MARIILDPNETFEHYHKELSYTKLLQGSASYITENLEIALQIDEVHLTPAEIGHTLKNTGLTSCVIECSHGGSHK